MSEPVTAVLLVVAQLVLMLALAPGLAGVIKRIKAALQARRGPPLLQPYFDIAKLLRKDAVYSRHASFVSRAAPVVYAASILAAALIVPGIWIPAPLAGVGDAIVVVGLFALARFALALAGLDTGSAFGGMGSSRDVAVAALAEPVVILGLFAVAWRAGTTDLSAIGAWLSTHPSVAVSPSQLLAFAAVSIAVIAETGRVPVDNPDTHLELTMVHEGMLLEYAGRPLGVLVWATQLKQLVLFSIVISLFAPFGIATAWADVPLAMAVFLTKLGVFAVLIAVVESGNAKLRILRVPELLGAASALAVLALVTEVFVG
jgi:formate hydrogenlyase subunit 4